LNESFLTIGWDTPDLVACTLGALADAKPVNVSVFFSSEEGVYTTDPLRFVLILDCTGATDFDAE